MVTTKFGPRSAVLLHLVAREMPGIPVVWIDTGYNTRATQTFAGELAQSLDLNLKVYTPEQTWSGWIPAPGEPEHEDFVTAVKLAPFAGALNDLRPDVWFSALRKSQSEHRSTQHHFNLSTANILKVCPLIHWSDDDMDAYMAANNLPGEKDYFDPTKAGPRRECGLHLNF